MTCDNLNKFIQVNIYGRTLQELSKQGIVLESLLNDIGCSRIWIGEGCMYNSPDSHNTSCSTESNSKENALIIEQAPVLSTTYATINCPRFSTPAVENRVDLERKFTLNLPQTISRINSSVVDSWIEEAEQPEDVENVLHEIVEKVANERENFSTTITKISLPRYSTPIPSHEHFLNESAFKVPDAISEIASDGEEEVIIEYAEEPSEERTVVEEEEKEKTVHRGEEEVFAQRMKIKQEIESVPLFSPVVADDGEKQMGPVQSGIENEGESILEENRIKQEVVSVSLILPKKRRSRRLSAPQLKSTVKIEESSEPIRKRPALSRCATEMKPIQTALPSSQSADPVLYGNEYLEVTAENEASPMKSDQGQNENNEQLEENAEVGYTFAMDWDYDDLTDRKPIVYFDHAEGTSDQVVRFEEVIEEPVVGYEHPDISMEMDYGDDDRMNYYSASEGDEEEEGNEEEEGGEEGDETEVMMVDDETPVLHTPPPMNQIDNTKSILKRTTTQGDDENRAKKTVSFKTRKAKVVTERQKKLNESHKISCHFENCNKVYNWKIRYGKQRLLDHAMTHIPNTCLACQTCDAHLSNSRQMNYHYRKMHPEVKCGHFNILEVLNMENDNIVVSNVFDQCFLPHSSVVGSVGKIRNKRMKRVKKEEKAPVEEKEKEEEEEEEEKEDDTPGTSDQAGPSNKYF
ncbi:hypothetical protein CAEBREN_14804 [Caenorhabditis brenneri]|uniref:C2H2-type domain-containing protein n=1 Tax=Caenorhabditis brenneri TaxID=135651 RepID=G0P5V4_CAEBE|nr:hypothetical protein CAEBREN_14804 [Caenorhabditis brenneri]